MIFRAVRSGNPCGDSKDMIEAVMKIEREIMRIGGLQAVVV